MATILLNGVETDASSISGSDLNDKLTVSGGVDGLSVDLADGDDAVEIYADSEDVTDSEIRVSEGDDSILVLAEDGTNFNNINDADDFAGTPISLGDSLLGGPGDDLITLDDGLVQLTGAVKGNEDDDTIEVANVNGGTVNGNAGDDTIEIGFATATAAGERGESALTNGSVMGGQGDDTIAVNADVTGSAIRGNEGDDTITVEGEFSGATTLNGNAGDDTIDASGAEGDVTVIGGSGEDVLIGGGGATVRGGRGNDVFRAAAEGGIVIEDYEGAGDPDPADLDCRCDEVIEVAEWAFDTAQYAVVTRLNTDDSGWSGDIKVKAVADTAGSDATAIAALTKTKTETITAFAVARAFITETNLNTAKAAQKILGSQTEYSVTYPRAGAFKTGETFANGNFSTGFNNGVTNNNNGIGAAFASAQGLWNSRSVTAKGNQIQVGGLVNPVTAQTSIAFEKGDFSFLDLTATAKVGVGAGQELLYNDVTNATVTNHSAKYIKSKTEGSKSLYSLNFGTNLFSTVTTGTAFMVLTEGFDGTTVYKTDVLTADGAQATAKAQLDLDDTFRAWVQVNSVPATRTFAGTNIYFNNDGSAATGGEDTIWRAYVGSTSFAAGDRRFKTEDGGATFKTAGELTAGAFPTGTDLTAKWGAVAATRETGTLLTPFQMLWQTVTDRGLATITTTAKFNTAKGFINVTKTVGLANTNVTEDDFVTATGKLVVKIQASDIATAKAATALDTVVERTTITGVDFDITTCPAFPTLGSLATRQVDGFAKHGEVTGTFNTQVLFSSGANNLNTQVSTVVKKGVSTNFPLISGTSVLATRVTALNAAANNGFFSASAFTVDALVEQSFGANAVAAASSDAQGLPFRVLFFDNEGSDNGLYVVSGLGNYDGGELTGLRTNASTVGGSTLAGKHTIVKVTGGHGHEIELSDINLI